MPTLSCTSAQTLRVAHHPLWEKDTFTYHSPTQLMPLPREHSKGEPFDSSGSLPGATTLMLVLKVADCTEGQGITGRRNSMCKGLERGSTRQTCIPGLGVLEERQAQVRNILESQAHHGPPCSSVGWTDALCQGSKCSAKSQPSPASHSSSWASASLSVK